MANNRILSISEIEHLGDSVAQFNSAIIRYYTNFDEMFKKLDNSEIMQSFYESGNFGQSNKERILQIRNVLEQYIDSIKGPGGLVEKTNDFISNQRELLTQEARGYSYNSSVFGRRWGNNG